MESDKRLLACPQFLSNTILGPGLGHPGGQSIDVFKEC